MNTYDKFMKLYDHLVADRDTELVYYIQQPTNKNCRDSFDSINDEFWQLMVSIKNDLEKENKNYE